MMIIMMIYVMVDMMIVIVSLMINSIGLLFYHFHLILFTYMGFLNYFAKARKIFYFRKNHEPFLFLSEVLLH